MPSVYRSFQLSIISLCLLLSVFTSVFAVDNIDSIKDTMVAVDEDPANLVYMNRTIFTFRATLDDISPAKRAEAALERIEHIVDQDENVHIRAVDMKLGYGIFLGSRLAFFIAFKDIPDGSPEEIQQTVQETTKNLQQALDEAEESKRADFLIRSLTHTLIATIIYSLVLIVIYRLRKSLTDWIHHLIEQGKIRHQIAGERIISKANLFSIIDYILRTLFIALQLFFLFIWLTYVMRQFPYSRPWGEKLGSYIMSNLEGFAHNAVASIPGLFVVILIFILARLINRIIKGVLESVHSGKIELLSIPPDTAPTTMRILNVFVWLFAIVAAYPYMPGSGSEVFKGMSVFVGLVISLGASNIVTQIINGLVLLYSRALKVGDFVKIGDVEGTVTNMGMFSTKVTTPRLEEVTLANSVVAGAVTINYSRLVDQKGVVILSTAITIGYDTPWRLIHEMLQKAAGKTGKILKDPAPFVLQKALSDFYVEYALMFGVNEPVNKYIILSELHGHIQDIFNHNGIQIMSPNYVADPPQKVVVPPEAWFTRAVEIPPPEKK